MKKHILLVDDDADEFKIFTDALREIPGSFHCTYAPTAAQGLEMLKYIHPNYVFLDYNLPEMNGLDMLAEIRTDRKLDTVPVFLYSTTISSDTQMTARHLGATGCIKKPSSVGMMRSVLLNVLVTGNVGVAG